MTYLIDTNVLSELRRSNPDHQVVDWFESVPSRSLRLSVLVLGELRQGVERLRRKDPRRADALDHWLSGIARDYAERVAPITDEIADRWGRLNASDPLPVVDGLLAATALVHDWTLVTRNVKDVRPTEVKLLNPYDDRDG